MQCSPRDGFKRNIRETVLTALLREIKLNIPPNEINDVESFANLRFAIIQFVCLIEQIYT